MRPGVRGREEVRSSEICVIMVRGVLMPSRRLAICVRCFQMRLQSLKAALFDNWVLHASSIFLSLADLSFSVKSTHGAVIEPTQGMSFNHCSCFVIFHLISHFSYLAILSFNAYSVPLVLYVYQLGFLRFESLSTSVIPGCWRRGTVRLCGGGDRLVL